MQFLEAAQQEHAIPSSHSEEPEREAFVMQAFKADEVDLPRDGTVAAHATITLPDDFNSLDFLSSTFAAQYVAALPSTLQCSRTAVVPCL